MGIGTIPFNHRSWYLYFSECPMCFVGRCCLHRPYSWLASYLGSDSGTATGSASNTSMPAERRFVKMCILSSYLGRTVNIPEKYAIAPGTRKGCHYMLDGLSVKCSGHAVSPGDCAPCGCQLSGVGFC